VVCDHLFEQPRGGLNVRPTDGGFPRPEVSPTRAAACPAGGLSARGYRRNVAFELRRFGATPVLPSGCPFPVPTGWNAARNQTVGRRALSPRGCRRSPGLRSKAVSGRIDTHFENHLWSSQHLGPEGRCPRSDPVPGVVQFSKQGRPANQRLQRTPEAFSSVVPCGGWRLRGRSPACNGRTLKRRAFYASGNRNGTSTTDS